MGWNIVAHMEWNPLCSSDPSSASEGGIKFMNCVATLCTKSKTKFFIEFHSSCLESKIYGYKHWTLSIKYTIRADITYSYPEGNCGAAAAAPSETIMENLNRMCKLLLCTVIVIIIFVYINKLQLACLFSSILFGRCCCIFLFSPSNFTSFNVL